MLPILMFVLFVNCLINTAALKCGENEVEDDCPASCPSDKCPTSSGQKRACFKPDPCPEPACKCRFNYRRAENGTCIPTRDCPAFDCPNPNEAYYSCPPDCPTDSCTQATPTGKCPELGAMLIVLVCQPTCRCIKGYWRNNGTCVPYDQCPNVSS